MTRAASERRRVQSLSRPIPCVPQRPVAEANNLQQARFSNIQTDGLNAQKRANHPFHMRLYRRESSIFGNPKFSAPLSAKDAFDALRIASRLSGFFALRRAPRCGRSAGLPFIEFFGIPYNSAFRRLRPWRRFCGGGRRLGGRRGKGRLYRWRAGGCRWYAGFGRARGRRRRRARSRCGRQGGCGGSHPETVGEWLRAGDLTGFPRAHLCKYRRR